MLSVSALKKAITDKTKAIIINTPNNPSGTLYPESVIREFAELLKEYPDIWVISDEIYEALSYDGNKHFSIACADEQIKERTILINGMSKAYAMTGWRIGYSASSTAAAKKMGAMQSHQTSNANTMAQHASIVALTKGQNFISEMRGVFESRRDALLDCFKDFKEVDCVKGGGAFYVMVNIKHLINKSYKGQKIDSALKFSQLLLENKYVAVIPCESFGAPDYVRLTYTLDIAVIKEGAKRFKDFVKEIC